MGKILPRTSARPMSNRTHQLAWLITSTVVLRCAFRTVLSSICMFVTLLDITRVFVVAASLALVFVVEA